MEPYENIQYKTSHHSIRINTSPSNRNRNKSSLLTIQTLTTYTPDANQAEQH